MAFRKRNVVVGRENPVSAVPKPGDGSTLTAPGLRPSPLTAHATTSTGTPSLDDVLGGHAGLMVGSSLLIEENGTTDFAGALLRYYAAEGICQGHVVHVVGVGDPWVRDLPGIAEEKGNRKAKDASSGDEKMKIAWRYEQQGPAGERANRSNTVQSSTTVVEQTFCHTFDLTKRLILPPNARLDHIAIATSADPFAQVIRSLTSSLSSSTPDTVHRLVVPTVLSPAMWPSHACRPDNFLSFLHAVRSLLRIHSSKLTAMITLPLELHPRKSGLVRWAELLSDGVLELTPFPHLMDSTSDAATKGSEEQPQGMLKLHKLPLITERSEGGAGAGNSIGDDLAFTVSRRKFAIALYSLPPVEGDQGAQEAAGQLTSKAVEF